MHTNTVNILYLLVSAAPMWHLQYNKISGGQIIRAVLRKKSSLSSHIQCGSVKARENRKLRAEAAKEHEDNDSHERYDRT